MWVVLYKNEYVNEKARNNGMNLYVEKSSDMIKISLGWWEKGYPLWFYFLACLSSLAFKIMECSCLLGLQNKNFKQQKGKVI